MAQNAQIIKFFFKEAWRQRKFAVATLIITPLTVLVERYVAPLLIAYVFANIQTGTINLQDSWWVLAAYFIVQVSTQVVGYRFILYMMWTVQVRGSTALYNKSFEKLTRHSLAFYSDNFVGSLVSKVSRFTSAFNRFWNAITFEVLFVLTSIVATIVGISFFIWQYALILLGLTILFIVVAYFGTRFLRRRFKEKSEAYTEISGKTADALSNMTTVKTDAREKSEMERLNVSVNNLISKEFFTRNGVVAVSSVYSFVVVLMKVGALAASIWSIQTGVGNAAVIYIVLTYTFNLIEEIWNVNNLLRNYYEIVGDSSEMFDILEQEVSVKEHSTRKLVVTKPVISIEQMSFQHGDTKEGEAAEPLFDNFSLHIKQNQKIGLVGVSGSGKSTLAKLLLRFYDVQKGKITIDGQDIARVTQDSLHENIAYVPQEPLLFHRSISENIAYARPEASEEEIRSAAKKANALEFIEGLKDGFDTLVGERGVKLSGGQRQRIAIARAILKDAPILILDEATSALDSESEKLIQDALTKLMKGRTSIVIAHRLSTIAALDRIIVLDNGQIVEDGTHDALLKKDGIYRKLWAHQSGGFIEE